MKTSLVAHLALAALVGTSLGSPLLAQDRAPRPRPAAENDSNPLRLRARGKTPRLGVRIDLTDDGLRVDEIEPGSLAQAAGVQSGDLLLRFDGESLGDASVIGKILGSARPGQSLPLTVVREGQGLVKLEVNIPKPVAKKKAPRAEQRQRSADGHQGGFLGVELGESADDGVTISDVIEGTAAWFAGLESGDILRSIDGHAIASPEDVVGAVSSRKPGSMITLAYTRDGDNHTAAVRLGQRGGDALSMTLPDGVFPQGITSPDGNVMFLNPRRGNGAQNWRNLFGADGNSFAFDMDDLKGLHGMQALQGQDWAELHEHMQDSMGDWKEQLHDHLKHLDVNVNGANIKIQIKDGVMTIDQGGETQTIDLSDHDALQNALGKVNLQGLQFLPDGLFDGDLFSGGLFDGGKGHLLKLGGDSGSTWTLGHGDGAISILRSGDGEGECHVKIECEASSDCEVSVDCDADVDCEVEVEDVEEVEAQETGEIS